MSGSSFRFTGKWIGQRYCIEQELGRGGMGAVYRAFHVDDPSNDVAIKVIHRSQRMTSSDLLRFQKEAALMSQLYHSNIIAFHELGIFQGEESKDFSGGYYIVMDYARGKNLKDSLADEGRKDLAFFFQVGLQVADALDYTHGKNIIHRDIKPHNIIVTQAPGDERGVQVKVLDFGVARLGSVIGKEEGNDERAGTPLYMAPEQSATGLGFADHRVDLYSLGCVLYEVLTGRPPFIGETRDELERAHQAAEPELVHHIRPDVPLIIAQIVHKLLAKKPDERYQTAFSLTADLLMAKSLWTAKPRSVPTFPLGLKDSFFAVSAQLPLKGRSTEIDAIMGEYKQVAAAKARGRITVVHGTPGMGKTRILNEFRGILSLQRIEYVHGVFTQHENALPFNALANAFNELLVKMMKTAPEAAESLSRKIKQVIGPDAHLVASIVPGLKSYLTEIPEPEEVLDIEGERYARFAKAFADFTKSLVPENQPLVMILDDVHWADEKSLALIEQFFSNANSTRFHLVLGCRLEVGGESSSFIKFVGKFRGLKLRYAEVALSPINQDAVAAIIKSMLRQQNEVSLDLAQHLLVRSSGIPMRLVELTRKLVALDYIRLSQAGADAEFDVAQIQATRIALYAVDLVLGKISDYKNVDLQILQAAATCGMVFQYEMLLLGGKFTPASVMRLIERATEDGIIVRCSEQPELKHLGKGYIFVHKKVRDAIYDDIELDQACELQGMVAEQLIRSIHQPKGQMLFAITHHLNKSRNAARKDAEKEKLALQYNIQSGDEIKSKQGWTAADNYYRLSLELIEPLTDEKEKSILRRRVLENLGDVNAGQTKFKVALHYYNQLLKEKMNKDEFAAIAAKTSNLHLVCGNITESLSLITKGLVAQGARVPEGGFVSFIKSFLAIAADVWGGFSHHKKYAQGLKKCWKNSQKIKRKDDAGLPLGQLLHLHSWAVSRQGEIHALSSVTSARESVLHGLSSGASAVRIMAERAGVLARFGFITSSYRLFDIAERFARSTGTNKAMGHIALLRAMTVDYFKGRMEDVSLHVREAARDIDTDQDRISHGLLLVFRQYLELLQGSVEIQEELNREFRLVIPTRNWLSPCSSALLMFSYLIRDKRQRLARYGEEFVRRRKAVGGRDDIFALIVYCMLFFARGEFDQTKNAYNNLIQRWFVAKDREWNFGWQSDFVEFFILIFPQFVEAEHGRSFLKGSELGAMFHQGFHWTDALEWFTDERPMRMLRRARIAEIKGKSDVRSFYDKALIKSKSEGNGLAQFTTYLWFGHYLVQLGMLRRGDYLNHALKLAEVNQWTGLANLTKRIMERLKVTVLSEAVKPVPQRSPTISEIQWPDVSMMHLDHLINCINGESELLGDLNGTVKMMREVYADQSVFIVMNDQYSKAPYLFKAVDDSDGMEFDAAKIAPYLTIRSTLVLHLTYDQVGHTASSYPSIPQDLAQTLKPVDPGEPLDSTQVIDLGEAMQAGAEDRNHSVHSEPTSVSLSQSKSSLDKRVSTLQALVPIRFNGETLGIMVLTEIGQVAAKFIHRTKSELDAVGAQLGLLIGHKLPSVAEVMAKRQEKIPSELSVMGGIFMEPVSWLNLRMVGKLRKEREASWYIGLNWGSQYYVIVYCCVKGGALERDRLATQILYQLIVNRDLYHMSGQSRLEVGDLRRALNGIMREKGLARRMDEVMLSYSVFDHSNFSVTSGHYGPARPVILGSDNRIIAFNEATVRLRDGRDLRYWEVYATLQAENVYIVSYDTSRIDGANQNFLSVVNQMSQTGDVEKTTLKLIETAVEQGVLPRYYLCVTRRAQ